MNNPPARTSRIVSNLWALGLGAIVSRTLNFVTAILLATRLGAAGYGALVYATTMVSYFQLLADFGLSVYGTRELARDPENARRQASMILAARFLFTLTSVTLLGLYLALLPQPLLVFWLMIALGMGIPLLAFSLEWAFQGVEAMGVVSLARIGQAAASAGLAALLVRGPNDILMAGLLPAASALVLTASLLALFARRYGLPTLRFRFDDLKTTVRAALPFGLSFIMIQIYYTIDRLLLWQYRSPAEVGWYDAAYRVVLVFTNSAALIAQAILPGLSSLARQGDLARARGSIGLMGKIMIYLGLPIAVGGALLAGPIIVLLYGRDYAPAVAPLRLLIWQVFTVFANVVFAQALLAFYHQRLYFISTLLGAALNLICNVFLIPRWGMVGAGAATIVAEVVVVSTLIAFVFRKIVTVPILPALAKAAAACALMAIVIYLIPFLWAQIALGGLVYGISLFALSPFSADERQRLAARSF